MKDPGCAGDEGLDFGVIRADVVQPQNVGVVGLWMRHNGCVKIWMGNTDAGMMSNRIGLHKPDGRGVV